MSAVQPRLPPTPSHSPTVPPRVVATVDAAKVATTPTRIPIRPPKFASTSSGMMTCLPGLSTSTRISSRTARLRLPTQPEPTHMVISRPTPKNDAQLVEHVEHRVVEAPAEVRTSVGMFVLIQSSIVPSSSGRNTVVVNPSTEKTIIRIGTSDSTEK